MHIPRNRRRLARWTLAALAACALAVGTDASGAGPAAAATKTCRHNMYLRSGIGPLKVERVTCRRAIRSVRRWVRSGMPGPGPRGWRCHRRKIGEEAPYLKVRCTRGRAQMRFGIGG